MDNFGAGISTSIDKIIQDAVQDGFVRVLGRGKGKGRRLAGELIDEAAVYYVEQDLGVWLTGQQFYNL